MDPLNIRAKFEVRIGLPFPYPSPLGRGHPYSLAAETPPFLRLRSSTWSPKSKSWIRSEQNNNLHEFRLLEISAEFYYNMI